MKTKIWKISLPIILIALFSACLTTQSQPSERQAQKADKTADSQSIRIAAASADAAEPAVAAAPDNGVYVVWVEHGKNKDADVFLQRFDNAGKALTKPVRINPDAGKAAAWRGDPPVVAAGKNNDVYVGWSGASGGADNHGNDIFLSVSSDGGQSFQPPVKVNDGLPAYHGMYSLAVDQNGRIYFAWLDERYLKKVEKAEKAEKTENQPQIHKQHVEANREAYFAVSSDGGKTFSENKRLASDVCPCCKTALAASDGRVYVAWRQVLPGNYRHIAVASSGDGGSNFSEPVIVSDDRWHLEGCPVSGAALSIGADNRLKVLWFSAGEAGKQGFYTAESADNGKTFSERTIVSEGKLTKTPMLGADNQNNHRAVFEKGGKITLISAQSGVQANENQRIIADGKSPAAAFAGSRIYVAFLNGEGENSGLWLSVYE